MKIAQNKSATASLQKKNASFFQKENRASFFSGNSLDTPFFSKHHNSKAAIQTKLTIGEPNDKYEQEADAMADKVVQRLATPGSLTKKDTGVQTKPLAVGITSLIQTKCTACEQEEKLQKKEEEDLVQESPLEIQRKPIFESNAEPPEDEDNIQRKCDECEKEEQVQAKPDPSMDSTASSSIEGRLNSSANGGAPIPSTTKQQMENSFGADFSNVRLHTNSTAAEMSKDLNAQAFTHGSNIYFNSGKFDANSSSGQHLLAHELTHTIQQGESEIPVQRLAFSYPVQSKLMINEPRDKNEKKAGQMADKVVQRLATPWNFSKKESAVASTQLAGNSSPLIQTKCAACEQEERLQKPGEEDLVQESRLEIQRKPIFESNAEPPEDENDIQRGCAACGKEAIVQTKLELSSDNLPVLQRQKEPDADPPIDKSYYEFIPTATLRITLGKVFFEVSPDATFQKGPKVRQIMLIILKKLIGDQFKIELIKPFEDFMLGQKGLERIGSLRGRRSAYINEAIGTVFLSIYAFYIARTYLEKQGLKVKLSDEENEKIQLGIHTLLLWEGILNSYKREGFSLPKWFDKNVFDHLMSLHMGELNDFDALLKKLDKAIDAETKYEADQKFDIIFLLIDRDFNILESTRQEPALQINPLTQLVYKSIWYLGDKVNLSKKPVTIRSVQTALAFIQFARDHPEYEGNLPLLSAFQREYKISEDEVKILPPFPSFIVAPDLNPDNSTVTTAKNTFRMITRFEDIHGTSTVHGVTVAMQMFMFHSWHVHKMPESLKKLKEQGTSPSDMVTLSNEFVKNSPQNLSDPVDSYEPEKSRERKVTMKPLGTGDFVLKGMAAPSYKKAMNMVQKPSTAGYPFSVFNAADLAKTSAYADWDMLTKLKNEAATADPDRKKELQNEIDSLERRESTDLLTLTKEDIADTDKLLNVARGLRDFIEKDWKENKPFYGNKTTDPFNIRLRKCDPLGYDLYLMIRETYPFGKYSDREAVNQYIEVLNKQREELTKLQSRSQVAYDSFKVGSPTYRVVAGLVKEDDGNLVPLILVAGYHPDAEPDKGKYKIKLVDVTFDSKKADMIYVGSMVEAADKKTGERDAVESAFDKFAGYHKYGKGFIVYRLPGTDYSGSVNSYTTVRTYLSYAIAALGLVLLVAGVLASGGLLSPVAAGVVSALGIGVGVAGAILSIQNIEERREKGVLEWDADTALDIINIIAGVVLAVGGIIKVTQVISKSVNLLVAIERAKGLYMVYDAVNIAANVYLINEKVQEDVAAIKKMRLPKHEEDELMSQVIFDAIQQGAMLAVSAYSLARGVREHFKMKAAGASYHSWQERGWIKEVNGRLTITDDAPPFIKAKMTLLGTAPPAEEPKTGAKGGTNEPDKQPTTTEEPPSTGGKTGGTSDKPATGTITEPQAPKPQTFDEKITILWQSRLKAKPPRLDACIEKLRGLKISEEDILRIVNNGTNHESPNDFFGSLNTFLKLGEARIGKAGLNKITEGLSNINNFEAASVLMQNVASVSAKYESNVPAIINNLSIDDVSALMKKMPTQENADTVRDLSKIAEHVDAKREEIFALIDETGQGAKGFRKFIRAIDRLGEGKFTPDQIRKSLGVGVEIEKAVAAGGGEMAKKIWGEKAALEAEATKAELEAKGIKTDEVEIPLKVADEHKAKKPGDRAYAHVVKNKEEIVHAILNAAGTDVDPVKWGVVRSTIENTDLPTITKNQIIGELWAASKLRPYETDYIVIREVTIEVVNAKGEKIWEAHLDAVLVNKTNDKDILYKELKSSEIPETRQKQTDTRTSQKEVYKRLSTGDKTELRPRGANAEKAFGGKKFPNFVAKKVDIERPP